MEFIELIKTPKHDNVVMIDSFGQKMEGTLCITSHHLIISSRNDQLNELFVSFYYFVTFHHGQTIVLSSADSTFHD